jgi:Regulator of chromosome condensation (RCC1) repeat
VRRASRLLEVSLFTLAAVDAAACVRPPANACGAAGAACCAHGSAAPTCASPVLTCAGRACGCLAQVTAVYDSLPVARLADGTIWAANDDQRSHFVEVLGPAGHFHATDVVASGSSAYGSATGCALEGDAVWCFPLAGPLIDSTDLGAGLGPGDTTSAAVQVVTSATAPRAPLAGARQLAASMNGGGASFCAVTGDGGVSCWGYDVGGILGHGDGADASFARPVLADAQTPFSGAVEVRLGYDSACVRKGDGSVWCWGDNTLAQLGSTSAVMTASRFPVPVTLPGPAKRLAAAPGNTHCAILRDGRVACWGWNEYAQAGADAANATAPPTIVTTSAGGPPLEGVVDLAPDRGMQAMCANTAAGLVCWGHPFPAAGAPDVTSPYPAPIGAAPVTLPLSSFGARDGSLVYVDADGRLVLGAGAFPFAAAPPCEGVSGP